MQLDAETTAYRPSHRPTVPRFKTVPSQGHLDAPTPSGFVERLRSESGYVALTVALDIWAASWAVVMAKWWVNSEDNRNIFLLSWLFVPFLVLVLVTRSMYRRKLNRGFLDDLEPVLTAVAVAALATLTVLMVAVPAFQPGDVVVPYVRPSEMIVRLWVCAAILVPGVRLVRSMAERYLRRKFAFGSGTLIIGDGPIVHQLITRMRQVPDYGLRPVGVLDDAHPEDANSFDVPYLGSPDNLEIAVGTTGATELIVAPSSATDEQLAQIAQQARDLGLRVRVVPRLMDALGRGTWVEHLGGIPLMVLCHANPRGWQFTFKYGMDRVIAALALALISPVYLGLALAVKLSSPGPVLFRQPRVGRDGKRFDCLKFRSMRPADPADAAFELKDGAAPGGVEGDDRRTRIGKFMRKTSLDELPQLVNVVRGDMTLVGPRPERPEFVELFELQVRRYGERHRVKAGITGWAQVHGLRGQTSIADRAEFDNYYIENWSLLLDFKIMILTVLAVLRPSED